MNLFFFRIEVSIPIVQYFFRRFCHISANNTGRHDITKILLRVALNTIPFLSGFKIRINIRKVYGRRDRWTTL
jgi:hypothetical protein